MLATVDVWALHAQCLVRALAGASASPADIRLQHRFADLLTDLRSYRFGETPTARNRLLSLGCASNTSALCRLRLRGRQRTEQLVERWRRGGGRHRAPKQRLAAGVRRRLGLQG